MKTIFNYLIVSFCFLISISAKGQEQDIVWIPKTIDKFRVSPKPVTKKWDYNKSYSFDVYRTVFFEANTDCGFGGAATVHGVYCDFLFFGKCNDYWGVLEEVDGAEQYKEHFIFSCSLGYQIPISKVLRFIPTIGYSRNQGTREYRIKDKCSDGVYIETLSKSSCDIGVVLKLCIPINASYLDIVGKISNNSLSVGVGISL